MSYGAWCGDCRYRTEAGTYDELTKKKTQHEERHLHAMHTWYTEEDSKSSGGES